MDVFTNTCKFNHCNRKFPSQHDLIIHIEKVHLDFSAENLERVFSGNPTCLPMSYVCRYSFEEEKIEEAEIPEIDNVGRSKIGVVRDIDPNNVPYYNNSLPSFFTWDSDLRQNLCDDRQERQYVCSIPGCTKRYKNINGIRYHSRHGHGSDMKNKKEYRCFCGKAYKTTQGLRTHSISHQSGVGFNYHNMESTYVPCHLNSSFMEYGPRDYMLNANIPYHSNPMLNCSYSKSENYQENNRYLGDGNVM